MPTIPVLLEPTPGGFRATTGAPWNLSAEAPTEEEALTAIRREYVMKQVAGLRVVDLALPEPDPSIEAARKLAANAFLDEWVAHTKEARRRRESEEDAAEADAEVLPVVCQAVPDPSDWIPRAAPVPPARTDTSRSD